MVDDWLQSAPGKVAAPPTLRWESGGGGSEAIFPVNTVIETVKDLKGHFLNNIFIYFTCYGSKKGLVGAITKHAIFKN